MQYMCNVAKLPLPHRLQRAVKTEDRGRFPHVMFTADEGGCQMHKNRKKHKTDINRRDLLFQKVWVDC
jgi:hypothetical protein